MSRGRRRNWSELDRNERLDAFLRQTLEPQQRENRTFAVARRSTKGKPKADHKNGPHPAQWGYEWTGNDQHYRDFAMHCQRQAEYYQYNWHNHGGMQKENNWFPGQENYGFGKHQRVNENQKCKR